MKLNVAVLLLLVFFDTGTGKNILWDIETLDGQPYNNVILDKFVNDTLFVMAFGNIHPISADSILFMKRKGKTYKALGFIVGAFVGALGWKTMIGPESEEYVYLLYPKGRVTLDAIAVTVFGGMVGLGAGAGLGRGEYYNLRKRDKLEKKILLKKIIQLNKEERAKRRSKIK